MEAVTGTDANRVRLLAVMAADGVGYSRLMSIDDRGTVARLDVARAVFRTGITRHAGRVIDMAGDSILAVFENATAAVQAALSIQQDLQQAPGPAIPRDRLLRFRIGLHLGDVIEKPDGSVYGDGVNIAARLEGLADPGGVTVSESIRITVKGRVEATFEDQGEQRVKNIGDAVRAYRVLSTASGAQNPAAPAATPSTVLSVPASDMDAEPGIAVLPFQSIGEEPQQAFLADGLVEDIIGSLTTVPGLLVIARSSTFTYRERTTDARTVGQELGVRYVLEGALRVMERGLRLNVNLVDCQSTGSLWSERFDAPMEDVLAILDEVTARIINSVRITIHRSEVRASRKLDPQSLQAWHLRAQALDHLYRWNRSEMLAATAISRRAIELAPGDSEGYAILAVVLWAAAVSGWVPAGAAAIEEARLLAVRSINLDEGLFRGHVVLSLILGGLGRHDEATAAAERAYELAPGDFGANSALGQALAYGGQYDEALPYFDRAVRLSPRDPMIYSVYQVRSIALFGLKRYEEVIAAAQRVSRQVPEWVECHTMLAAGLMGMGNLEQARKAISSAMKLDPRLTVRRAMRRHPLANAEDASRLGRFLRDAGVPET